jgi:bacterioferritin
MQPADEQTDVVHLIHGVIEAETGAIAHYSLIIDETDGVDYPTQDMVIGILRDEERHRRLFEGFLREYSAQADAGPLRCARRAVRSRPTRRQAPRRPGA